MGVPDGEQVWLLGKGLQQAYSTGAPSQWHSGFDASTQSPYAMQEKKNSPRKMKKHLKWSGVRSQKKVKSGKTFRLKGGGKVRVGILRRGRNMAHPTKNNGRRKGCLSKKISAGTKKTLHKPLWFKKGKKGSNALQKGQSSGPKKKRPHRGDKVQGGKVVVSGSGASGIQTFCQVLKIGDGGKRTIKGGKSRKEKKLHRQAMAEKKNSKQSREEQGHNSELRELTNSKGCNGERLQRESRRQRYGK